MSDAFARTLTDAQVRNAKPQDKPYKLPDGGGMFLLVNPNGSKLWRYKFRLSGLEGLDALGAYPEVNLAAAREAHRASRALVDAGVNPVHHRKAERERRESERLEAAQSEFTTVLASWRDVTDPELAPGTVAQRTRELDKYLVPEFKGRDVRTISRVEISALLKRTAVKVRRGKRMEGGAEVTRNLRTHLFAIFEHACDLGVAAGNPVPPPRVLKARQQQNHAAMPVESVGEFLLDLKESATGPGAQLALMLVLWSVSRKGEATGATWSEFSLEDEAAGAWDIPASRMKGRLEHWVPLPRQAVLALREWREWSAGTAHLFPNRRDPERPMADRTLNATLDRLGYSQDATIHGFRAMFSTRYNADPLNADVVERCLAHAPKDKTRAAYNRFDYAPQRRAILQDWADWLDEQVAAEKARRTPLVA